jgi:hypothetical protein
MITKKGDTPFYYFREDINVLLTEHGLDVIKHGYDIWHFNKVINLMQEDWTNLAWKIKINILKYTIAFRQS